MKIVSTDYAKLYLPKKKKKKERGEKNGNKETRMGQAHKHLKVQTYANQAEKESALTFEVFQHFPWSRFIFLTLKLCL